MFNKVNFNREIGSRARLDRAKLARVTTAVMQPTVIRNTLVFWLLMFGMALGQERRDPTQPSAAIQRKLMDPASGASATQARFKVKAIVLSDRDHGTALVETAGGVVKIRLDRQHPTEVTLGESKYLVKDFNSSSVVLTAMLNL